MTSDALECMHKTYVPLVEDIHVASIARLDQSDDSTAWVGFLKVFKYHSWYCVNYNQLPTPTLYCMHECQDSLIQCSTSRVFVSILIPWVYSCLLWTTETVLVDLVVKSQTTSATVYRHFMLWMLNLWLHWTGFNALETRCGGYFTLQFNSRKRKCIFKSNTLHHNESFFSNILIKIADCFLNKTKFP